MPKCPTAGTINQREKEEIQEENQEMEPWDGLVQVYSATGSVTAWIGWMDPKMIVDGFQTAIYRKPSFICSVLRLFTCMQQTAFKITGQ